jgi:hypothetical protein
VKPPIIHLAAALVPPLGSLYRPFDASGATDDDALLKAPACTTVDAEQIFLKKLTRYRHMARNLGSSNDLPIIP